MMASMVPPTALPTDYAARRNRLETYFDRTASQTWARLTSDAPVSGIRATVRAGRNRMRETLLSWLPADMTGLRLLDAGCGTGALAVEAARRGAALRWSRSISPPASSRSHATGRRPGSRSTGASATCATLRSASPIMSSRWIR
jgi:SAM-dependent methyltransferase